MDEGDMDAWRAKKMADMQSQQQEYSDKSKAEEQQRAVEDMKNSILSQVLTQSGRARLNTLLLAKPEKGKMVENMLLRMAQMGQITSKLQEEELINLMERMNLAQSSQKKTTTVKFDRRRAAIDDSDDD